MYMSLQPTLEAKSTETRLCRLYPQTKWHGADRNGMMGKPGSGRGMATWHSTPEAERGPSKHKQRNPNRKETDLPQLTGSE